VLDLNEKHSNAVFVILSKYALLVWFIVSNEGIGTKIFIKTKQSYCLTVRTFAAIVQPDAVALADGHLQVAAARVGDAVGAAHVLPPLLAAVQLAERPAGLARPCRHGLVVLLGSILLVNYKCVSSTHHQFNCKQTLNIRIVG
jgi:hypothetical protein